MTPAIIEEYLATVFWYHNNKELSCLLFSTSTDIFLTEKIKERARKAMKSAPYSKCVSSFFHIVSLDIRDRLRKHRPRFTSSSLTSIMDTWQVILTKIIKSKILKLKQTFKLYIIIKEYYCIFILSSYFVWYFNEFIIIKSWGCGCQCISLFSFGLAKRGENFRETVSQI
jgi:hypothetical protein